MIKDFSDVTVRPDLRDVTDLDTLLELSLQYLRYENEISYEFYCESLNMLQDRKRFMAHYMHLVHSFIFDVNSLERCRNGFKSEE